MDSIKPILIFGYGNLSRGDDALGPLLLDYIQDHFDPSSFEIQTDFQLQIEHALDMIGRSMVLFIDASVDCSKAFDFTRLTPACDKSYTTHAMSPAAVLEVYRTIRTEMPPPSFLLSIKGEQFELGAALSPQAESNLERAKEFIQLLLSRPDLTFWLRQTEAIPDLAET